MYVYHNVLVSGHLLSPRKRWNMFSLALICVCVSVCDHDN